MPQFVYRVDEGTKRQWSKITKRTGEATAPLIVLAGVATILLASTTPMNPLVAHSKAKNAKTEAAQTALIRDAADHTDSTGSSTGTTIPNAANKPTGSIAVSTNNLSAAGQTLVVMPPNSMTPSDPTTPVIGGVGGDDSTPVDTGMGSTTPTGGDGLTGATGTGGTTGDDGSNDGDGGILPPVTNPLPDTIPMVPDDTDSQPIINVN